LFNIDINIKGNLKKGLKDLNGKKIKVTIKNGLHQIRVNMFMYLKLYKNYLIICQLCHNYYYSA